MSSRSTSNHGGDIGKVLISCISSGSVPNQMVGLIDDRLRDIYVAVYRHDHNSGNAFDHRYVLLSVVKPLLGELIRSTVLGHFQTHLEESGQRHDVPIQEVISDAHSQHQAVLDGILEIEELASQLLCLLPRSI